MVVSLTVGSYFCIAGTMHAGTTIGDKMLDASNVCTPPPSNGTAAEMRKKPNKE